MIAGDELPKHILINTPSRDYSVMPKDSGERELTPYGIASVATFGRIALKRLGIQDGVGLIDAENFGMSADDIVNEIKLTGDEVRTIGINVLTPTFLPTMQLSKRLRESFPESRIFFGGPHATLDPMSILKYTPDGLVVVGDGENPFLQIMLGTDVEKVNGLISNEIFTAKRKIGHKAVSVVTDLNTLPWIDRGLILNEPYLKDDKKTMAFLSSRGCVGNCSFCISNAQHDILKDGGAKKMRFRHMEDVIHEVLSLSNQFDIAQFIDDDMFPSSKKACEFLDLWEKHGLSENKEFRCLLRPDQISSYGKNGLLKKLYDAGLKKISFGIETGHERGRRMLSSKDYGIDKKYLPEVQVDAIRYCSNIGIETKGFFMVGLPGETKSEISQTLEYARLLGQEGLNKIAIFPFKAYPNTKLWNYALQLGYTPEQLEYYDTPDVRSLIMSGMSTEDASRDGIAQHSQLSKIPTAELNNICQIAMNDFNNKKRI